MKHSTLRMHTPEDHFALWCMVLLIIAALVYIVLFILTVRDFLASPTVAPRHVVEGMVWYKAHRYLWPKFRKQVFVKF